VPNDLSASNRGILDLSELANPYEADALPDLLRRRSGRRAALKELSDPGCRRLDQPRSLFTRPLGIIIGRPALSPSRSIPKPICSVSDLDLVDGVVVENFDPILCSASDMEEGNEVERNLEDPSP
jgi:hypothetical protein